MKILLQVLIILLFYNILVYFIPGDQVDFLMGNFSDEEKNLLRESFHLKKDFLFQLKNSFVSFFSLNLGYSYVKQEFISNILFEHILTTLKLSFSIFLCIFFITFLFSFLFTYFSLSLIKKIFFSLMSIPSFILGSLGLYFFSYKYYLFPLGGDSSFFLPAISFGIPSSSYITKQIIDLLAQEKESHYIRFQKSLGISSLFLLMLKNILVQIIGILTSYAISILGGLVVIERIFDIPGVGFLLNEAISTRDFPLVQAILFYNLIIIFIFLNFSLFIQKKVDKRLC
jgi:peptide/nickel transport system permease protein